MLDQKKMLIDSMKKLISHVSSNKQHQIQIYKSLTKGDLDKILGNLEDQNSTLRKMSAQLICELLFNNQSLKQQFGQLMGIRPANGYIVINKIPEALIKRPNRLLQSMRLLKTSFLTIQTTNKNLCCFIDPLQSQLTIKLINIGEQFVDPKNYLLLIPIPTNVQTKSIHQSVVLELRANLKQRPRTSITSIDTDRYYRGIKEIRVKIDDKMNLTQDQFRLPLKTSIRNHQDRSNTQQEDYLRVKTSQKSNILNNSLQATTLKGIDKTLRQKKNQKHGISMVSPGHLSDRNQRDLYFNSKSKLNNSFMGQLKNSFLASREISSNKKQSCRPRVQVSSHRESFDSFSKSSQTFLKKYRDSQKNRFQ